VAAILEILPAAAEEAREAARWYAARNLVAAAGFEVEVRRAFAEIAAAPHTWPTHLEGTRRFLLERFPYEVVFLLRTDRVLVIAIAHCKRRPGYWRERAG
jgi:plasmid stabilization system protein ParE